MREVIFQESGMKNFGPYIDPMVLTFPEDKLTLLTGPNGIGKTMALDSIPFTLYGITSKKAKGDDVVNNVIGKNCKTWVKFTVNDNQYIVTRYHKYTKLNNTVILNRNGEDIKKGQREVLPEIEKLVCPQKAFMNTLMFGQKIKDFFTDLVDSDKKEIFRKILGLEQYLIFYKQTSSFLKDLITLKGSLLNKIEIDKGLREDAEFQINTFLDLKNKFGEKQEKTILDLRKTIKDNERLLKNWKRILDQLKADSIDIESTTTELNKIQNELSSLDKNSQTELAQLEKQKQVKVLELNNEADKNKSKISSEFSEQIKQLDNKINDINKKVNDETLNNQKITHQIDLKINKLRSDQENNAAEIVKTNNNVLEAEISTCPTCEQEVTDDVKNRLIEKTETLQKEIDQKEDQINDLELKKSIANKKFQQIKQELDNKKDDINLEKTKLASDEETQKNNVDKRLKSLIDKVSSLVIEQQDNIANRKNDAQRDLKEKEKELQEQKADQERIKEEIDKIEDTISSLEYDIKNLISQLEREEKAEFDETQLDFYNNRKQVLEASIKETEEELQDLENQISMHEFWKIGFSATGIPSMLIDDSIPFMNEKISEYLDLITNGRYIVSFDTLDETKSGEFRDKISVNVIDTETKANSRVQLSGGQTRIIDIATILTLGDLQANIQDVKFNILLFDEIFDALDYDNATYVSKVLNKLKLGKSIYVISHQHQEQLEPDEHLEFLGVKK